MAARKLLKRDFALTLTNPLTGQVEIASHFKKLINLRNRAQQLLKLENTFKQNNWLSTFFTILIHPILLINIIKIFIKDTQNYEHHSKSIESLQKSIDFMDDSIKKLQSLEELHQYADNLIFSPLYLREAPFVRVGLQPVFIQIDGEDIGVNVWLLIHRSGVAILTFGVKFSQSKTTDKLILLQYATREQITESKVVKDIILNQARLEGIRKRKLESFPSEKQFSSGVNWYKYIHKEPISFADIFNLYQISICSTIQGRLLRKNSSIESWVRSPNWFAYPIIFLRHMSPEYHVSENIEKYHLQEIAGILWRYINWSQIKTDKARESINNDLSIRNDYKLYINTSHATIFHLQPYIIQMKIDDNISTNDNWLLQHFQTSSIIEAVLLQKWILHILTSRLVNTSQKLSDLNNLKKDMIFGLEEYHNYIFSFSNANDIITHSRYIMNIDNEYKNLLLRFDEIQKLIEVEESQNNSKKSLSINVSVIILTLVSGLAGVDVIVNNLQNWGWLFIDRNLASKYAYIAITLLVIIPLLWSIWPNTNKRSIFSWNQNKPSKKHNLLWPDK